MTGLSWARSTAARDKPSHGREWKGQGSKASESVLFVSKRLEGPPRVA